MGRNSTIINKKKRLLCGCYDFNFSKGRCKQHATIEDTNKRVEKYEAEQLGRNDEEESRTNLIEDLDAVVSRYIRLKYANEAGLVSCYTCGTVKHFTKMQCAHYIGRAAMATRFLESNLRCCCPYCNENLNGNLEVYRENLNKELDGLADWLQEQAREITKPTKYDLRELLISYRHKLKFVESKLSNTKNTRTPKNASNDNHN